MKMSLFFSTLLIFVTVNSRAAESAFLPTAESLVTQVPISSYGDSEIAALGSLVGLCETVGKWTFGDQYKLVAVANVGTGGTGGKSVYAEGTCLLAYSENLALKAILVPLGAEQTVFPEKTLVQHEPIILFDLKRLSGK